MLKIDLHTHTANSRCGHHSLWEVLNFARERGIELLGVTDHGPAQEPVMRGTFFDDRRVPVDFHGVRMLKGLEGNLIGKDGKIDLTPALLRQLDIVLVGLHGKGYKNYGEEINTNAVLAMLENGPMIDMITHPDIASFPLDFERVVPAAVEHGVILELNDANIFLGKTDVERARRMIALGAQQGALFAINSDAHTWIEYGRDENMRQWLRDIDAPAIDIVNDWPRDKVIERLADRKRERVARLDADKVALAS